MGILAVLSFPLAAQHGTFDMQVNELSFREFVDVLEEKTSHQVFYAVDWVDSLFVSVDAQQATIGQVMTQALYRSGLTFIITEHDQVILTRGQPVKTDFMQAFEQHLKARMTRLDTSSYPVIEPAEEEEDNGINEEFRLYKIGNPTLMDREGKVELSGTILDAETGVPVAGAIVYIRKLQIGTSTDAKGNFALLLPRGKHTIEFRRVGLKSTIRNLIVYSGGMLNVEMEEKINQLEEVVVTASQENRVLNLRMGTEKINMKMLKQIPMGLGEVDVIKSSLLLPGVQSVGEAAAGYNVRGGNTDQNLVLLNGAPILNSTHFFGFFSSFNSDVIQDLTLYKSGIPAAYGGRISSVMDIRLKEGNKEEFKVSGGISPVTGRLMVEGPVKKNISYVLSARSTYSDWILKQMKDKRLQNSHAGFYDIQGIMNIQMNHKNQLSLSGYYSRDRFNFHQVSTFKYMNGAATVKWHHIFRQNLFADFSAILSDYNYQISHVEDEQDMDEMHYQMNQRLAKADFTYFPVEKHKIYFGLQSTLYDLAPGEQFPLHDSSTVVHRELEESRALESSVYVSDVYALSPSITLSGGLRFNVYAAFGPGTEYLYSENYPLSQESLQDTVHYSAGEVTSLYPNLEYRFSSRFLLGPSLSVKLSIQRMFQYIYMISNTTAISPTDIWELCDSYIKPQRSDQYSLGVYRSFSKNTIEASVEAYYRDLDNIIDYKSGADLLMNELMETVLLSGKGKAYGIEFMLKKNSGPVTGWLGYTYARIFHQVDGDFEEERINNGKWFPAIYDKPHDLKVVINTKFSRRFNMTGNFVFNTGRPITYPAGYFEFGGLNRFFYSDRNEFRMPDYIRLDLAATYNGNLLVRKLNHSSLTFAIYNVLGRRNPYSIFFRLDEGVVNAYKMSIFGQPIFTITYNFKIRGNASEDF